MLRQVIPDVLTYIYNRIQSKQMKLIVTFISSIIIVIWMMVYKQSIKWLWQHVAIVFIHEYSSLFL